MYVRTSCEPAKPTPTNLPPSPKIHTLIFIAYAPASSGSAKFHVHTIRRFTHAKRIALFIACARRARRAEVMNGVFVSAAKAFRAFACVFFRSCFCYISCGCLFFAAAGVRDVIGYVRLLVIEESHVN